jgi:transglycosylase-like protein with SLT domain/D-alanyl-D-alanine carboxypeptidase-like protein/putative Flp pilus-assembly TadE/G-like protein
VRTRFASDRGQAAILMLGALAALIVFALVLASLGQALGARGRAQRVADLAAISGARAMRVAYPRLFEPPYLRPGMPNPRHLDLPAYLARARAAALDGARRNGFATDAIRVSFPDASSFAPTRVAVDVRDRARVRIPGDHPAGRPRIRVRAHAEAGLTSNGSQFAITGGDGEYRGPFAHRQGKPMRPDTALAFDRMARSAAAAGINLVVVSAFRSNAEQAALFARHPDPRWVAPPGRSLHRLGTELDLGPPSAYGWLAANAGRFGFIRRYSWEPWHFGYSRSPGTASVGFGAQGGDGRATAAVQSFVPQRFVPAITRAAQRWSVSAQLLAAQLYAESNFNPFAVSPAGARGIAQFMPGTAAAYGLRNAFDPTAAIDAQAHLMHDLLVRFASVPLALAAYNAGPGAVSACGCVPAIPETQAYVARILGLLGGAGQLTGAGLEVRLLA